MGQAVLPPPVLTPPVVTPPARKPAGSGAVFRFRSLEPSGEESLVTRRGTTFTMSLLVHSVLVIAVLIVPLLLDDVLPAPSDAVRAFFVTPTQVAPPPPPPPPPPAAGARVVPKAPAAARLPDPGKFTAPVEIPQEIPQEEALSLGGVEGGVPGGVEGGVPGGVVGGIVGGLPQEAPPPPKIVRVGGQIRAPKKIQHVPPVYPALAQAARLQAIVILEAHVNTSGRVQSTKVLRGQPLFDEAATEAVRQWRYMPLLLNGQPTEFLLTVTVQFNLKSIETN